MYVNWKIIIYRFQMPYPYTVYRFLLYFSLLLVRVILFIVIGCYDCYPITSGGANTQNWWQTLSISSYMRMAINAFESNHVLPRFHHGKASNSLQWSTCILVLVYVKLYLSVAPAKFKVFFQRNINWISVLFGRREFRHLQKFVSWRCFKNSIRKELLHLCIRIPFSRLDLGTHTNRVHLENRYCVSKLTIHTRVRLDKWYVTHTDVNALYTLLQRFSTYDTRVICDTLTKKLWHFAFIFMWHSWSNNIKKMTPRQKKVERTVVHYWLVTTHYSFVQIPSNLNENLSWKYHKIYK